MIAAAALTSGTELPIPGQEGRDPLRLAEGDFLAGLGGGLWDGRGGVRERTRLRTGFEGVRSGAA